MSELNIVLLEPQIPQNTGNIARTCAALGATLHLIRPLGFTITDSKLKRAGLDYWKLLPIEYHDSWDSFARRRPGEYYFFSARGDRHFAEIAYPPGVYLVFGREDTGLPGELLRTHRDRVLRIPHREEARSLNLSNAVAVAAYEALRRWEYPGLSPKLPADKLEVNHGKD